MYVDRAPLKIYDSEQDSFATFIPHMPLHLHEGLLDKLEMAFPNILQEVDSKSEGINHTFPTFLFSWYNRYCADVGFFFLFKKNILILI